VNIQLNVVAMSYVSR